MERKLRESEERFRSIFEQAPFGVCVSGDGRYFIRVNAAFCRMLGYSEKELLAAGWADISHPEDQEVSLRMLEQLRIDPDSCPEGEKRYIHRSGAVVWIRLKISLVRDPTGPAYYVAHAEDITERKRAEEALHESEDRFRVMADCCPTIMWVTNAEGGIQFINQKFRELCGVTLEQVEGGRWQSLLHPDDAPQYLGELQRAVRDKAPFQGEVRARRADGEWRCVGSHAAPRFSSSGAFLGHIGLSSDITERMQNEKALHFSTLPDPRHSRGVAVRRRILVVSSENRIVSHNKRFLGPVAYSSP